MNLLTSIVPSLLIAIGFTEDVHMLVEYHASLEEGRPKLEAIREVLRESALPLTITSATTVVGFATLIFTDVTMLVQVGIASSLGLTANFVVTVLLVPMALRYWPVPRRPRRSALAEHARDGRLIRFLDWLGRFDLAHRRAILVTAGLVTVGSLVGWWNLRVDTDSLSLLPRHSVVRERVAEIGHALGGALNFYVVVDTGRPDGVKDPIIIAFSRAFDTRRSSFSDPRIPRREAGRCCATPRGALRLSRGCSPSNTLRPRTRARRDAWG